MQCLNAKLNSPLADETSKDVFETILINTQQWQIYKYTHIYGHVCANVVDVSQALYLHSMYSVQRTACSKAHRICLHTYGNAHVYTCGGIYASIVLLAYPRKIQMHTGDYIICIHLYLYSIWAQGCVKSSMKIGEAIFLTLRLQIHVA